MNITSGAVLERPRSASVASVAIGAAVVTILTGIIMALLTGGVANVFWITPILVLLIICVVFCIAMLLFKLILIPFNTVRYEITDTGITIRSPFRTVHRPFVEMGKVSFHQSFLQKWFKYAEIDLWSKANMQARASTWIQLTGFLDAGSAMVWGGYRPQEQFELSVADARAFEIYLQSKLTPFERRPGGSSSYEPYLKVDVMRADLLEKKD
jgi:hypothetical protein